MASTEAILQLPGVRRGENRGKDVHIPVELEVKPQPNPPTALQFEARAYDDVAPLIGMLPYSEMTAPGFTMGLSIKQDCLIEVENKLNRILADEKPQ
jgi:hypothetical protein